MYPIILVGGNIRRESEKIRDHRGVEPTFNKLSPPPLAFWEYDGGELYISIILRHYTSRYSRPPVGP